MLTLEDKLAIHELINDYGHIIDKGEFQKLGGIFTSDATFDLSAYQDGRVYSGIAEIVDLMEQSTEHPVAHHATNIVIGSDDIGDGVSVESKGIGVGRKGRVGSVVYRDHVCQQEGQWKIRRRTVQLLTKPGSQRHEQ